MFCNFNFSIRLCNFCFPGKRKKKLRFKAQQLKTLRYKEQAETKITTQENTHVVGNKIAKICNSASYIY